MSNAWHWLATLDFAHPLVFWLAWLAPLAVAGLHLYDAARRRQLTRRLGELPVITRVMASTSPGRRLLKDALSAIALTLLLLAIARPQHEGERKVELHGLDLVVAVDVSKSMLVDDVGPTTEMQRKKLPTSRLERARELAGAVIYQLPGDRFGPVVFAGAASHFPLTEDSKVATDFLNDLGPNDLPQGSNLAEVFRVSRCLLRPDLYEDLGCARIGRRGHGGDALRGESLDPKGPGEGSGSAAEPVVEKSERGKAMLILTDGGDPDEDAMREVATARELGIAVFIVGVGTPQGGVVYEIDPFTGKRTTSAKLDVNGATVTSKRDDAGMRALAAAAGDEGRYLVAPERGEVDPMPIVLALRAVNRGLATKDIKEKKDVFEPFLFAGLMLLVIEAAIGTRRRRPYPEAR
jgi:Ca-activated chloride channel family protein